MAPRFRTEGEPPPEYGVDSSEFSLEIHHGGFFCGTGVNRAYVDGKVAWYDHVEADSFCFLWLEDLIIKLNGGNANDSLSVYWLLPGKDLSDGLRIVASDEDTLVMRSVAQQNCRVKNFELYFDHYSQITGIHWDDVVLNPVAELPTVISPCKVRAPDFDKLPDFYNNLEKWTQEKEGSELSGSVSQGEDNDLCDSDYDFEDGDDDLFADNVDENVMDESADEHVEKGSKLASDAVGGYSDDEIELPDDSDNEGIINIKFKSFNPEDLVNPSFRVGMVFSSVELLRKAITEYSMKHRVDIKLPRNDRQRVQGHCAVGCPWLLYASFDSRAKTFMIKRYVGEHSCRKEFVLSRCTAKWLAEKYVESFRADTKMTLGNFARIVQKDWNLTPCRSKLSRARRIAMEKIYGDEDEQYNMLWDYGVNDVKLLL